MKILLILLACIMALVFEMKSNRKEGHQHYLLINVIVLLIVIFTTVIHEHKPFTITNIMIKFFQPMVELIYG